jgi:hypothetical protein
MNTAKKRLILAAGVLVIAEVAMAASPKSSIDTDVKDLRVANVTATSPKDDTTNYTCDYVWQITFSGGATTQDNCEVMVPAGSKNAVVCTKKYDRRISVIALLYSSCKPTPP